MICWLYTAVVRLQIPTVFDIVAESAAGSVAASKLGELQRLARLGTTGAL